MIKKKRKRADYSVNKRNANYTVKCNKGAGGSWRFIIQNAFRATVETSTYKYRTQVLAKTDGDLRRTYWKAQ